MNGADSPPRYYCEHCGHSTNHPEMAEEVYGIRLHGGIKTRPVLVCQECSHVVTDMGDNYNPWADIEMEDVG